MNNTSETVSIKKLTGWDKNPRGIKKDDYNRLKKQIQDLGVYKPLLVNEDYVVLGGNMRLKVLTDLGVENVWVSVVKASTPEMMTKYALSDNDEAGYYEEQALAELLMPLEINLDDYRVNLGKPISITELLAKFGPTGGIDFDNIESTEDRKKNFEKQTVTCPQCEHSFEIMK